MPKRLPFKKTSAMKFQKDQREPWCQVVSNVVQLLPRHRMSILAHVSGSDTFYRTSTPRQKHIWRSAAPP